MALTVGVFLLLFGAGLWAFTRMGHRFAMVERGVGLVKKKRRIAFSVFFFNDTATTEIYTLSLHDALPISKSVRGIVLTADNVDINSFVLLLESQSLANLPKGFAISVALTITLFPF